MVNQVQILPRFIRFRDAPKYLGMDRNRFNKEVRPFIKEIPIGTQGIAFDRVDLDAWADYYKESKGRSVSNGRLDLWDARKTPGLQKRGDFWYVDKKIFGRRLCESTGTNSLEKAEQYLARRIEQIRQNRIYGVRPKRIFKEAATKFVMENQHKRSINSDVEQIEILKKYIGNLPRKRCT